MIDMSKVDWTEGEKERAEKLVALFQAVDGALEDGFQPIQDITAIAPSVWGQIDSIRKFISDFVDSNGRRPSGAEFAAAYGQSALMMARHEGLVPRI